MKISTIFFSSIIILCTLLFSLIIKEKSILLLLLLFFIYISGALLRKFLLKSLNTNIFENIGINLITGLVFFSFLSLFVPNSIILLIFLILLVIYLLLWNKQENSNVQTIQNYLIIGFGFLVSLVYLFGNLFLYGVLPNLNYDNLHPDIYNFEAIGNSIYFLNFSDSFFASTAGIKYHWYSYFLSASITNFIEIPPYVSQLIIIYLITNFSAILILTGQMIRLNRSELEKFIAIILLLLSGYIILRNGSFFNFDSPSQNLGIVFSLMTIGFLITKQVDLFSTRIQLTINILLALIVLTKPSFSPAIFSIIFVFYILNYREIHVAIRLVSFFINLLLSGTIFFLFIRGNPSGEETIEFFKFNLDLSVIGSSLQNFNFSIFILFLLFFLGISSKFAGTLIFLLNEREKSLSLISLTTLLSTFFLLFIISDSSKSTVNLMWFLLGSSIFLIHTNAIGYARVILYFGKANKLWLLLILFIIIFIYLLLAFGLITLNTFLIIFCTLLVIIYIIKSYLTRKNYAQYNSILYLIVLIILLLSILFRFSSLTIYSSQTNSTSLDEIEDSSYASNTDIRDMVSYINNNLSKYDLIYTSIVNDRILKSTLTKPIFYSDSSGLGLFTNGLLPERLIDIDYLASSYVLGGEQKMVLCKYKITHVLVSKNDNLTFQFENYDLEYINNSYFLVKISNAC